MTSLNREQMSILLLLCDDTHQYSNWIEPTKIGRRFSPPIPLDQVHSSLSHLVKSHFADVDGKGRYRISHIGSEIARITLQYEGKHKLKPEMVIPRSAWSFEEDEPPGSRRRVNSIDWTKWGTIFGGLSIIVAIILAVVN